jgi:MoxR-like ATPase
LSYVFQSRIERTEAGEIRLHLVDEERALIREIAEELGSLLDESPDDPSLRRLFPPAHEDEELEREYRELTGGQLAAGRERAIETLRDTADQAVLTPDEADAWLRALNDARLVLGTRLDISEDFDWDAFDASDPRAPELALYAYLSWFQEQLVEAI